jgi:hypothetical protein
MGTQREAASSSMKRSCAPPAPRARSGSEQGVRAAAPASQRSTACISFLEQAAVRWGSRCCVHAQPNARPLAHMRLGALQQEAGGVGRACAGTTRAGLSMRQLAGSSGAPFALGPPPAPFAEAPAGAAAASPAGSSPLAAAVGVAASSVSIAAAARGERSSVRSGTD